MSVPVSVSVYCLLCFSCVAFARDVVFPRRQCVSLRGNGCMPTSLPRFVYLGYFACLLCLFALIACSVVLHEETEGANMSNRRYRRRSKMKRRGVKNASQNGSKMATWRPLGSPWAPTLLPDAPRSRPGEALARPGASQKSILAALERAQEPPKNEPRRIPTA